MAAYTRLTRNSWFQVVDRIGFLEITRRGVTGIAIPTIRINCGMHRINWMTLGKKDRVVVWTVVASTATCCVGWMYCIHKLICLGKTSQRI